MTDRRRYRSLAMVATVGLVVALAGAVLLDEFADAFISGRTQLGKVSPVTATVSEPDSARLPIVMSLHDTPQAIPAIQFADGDGRPVALADFHGKLVLLNIWATWCSPCRREMPTLDHLQATLGGSEFEVVALSIDRAGIAVVNAFYAEIGIRHLARYIDQSGAAARHLNTVGLPTTLLVDRDGREIARYVGPAEWDAPEMIAFFRKVLDGKPQALLPNLEKVQTGVSGVGPFTAVDIHRRNRPIDLDATTTEDLTPSSFRKGIAR